MTRKRLLISWLLALSVLSAGAQTRNQRDAAGRKQGYWEAVDSKGALVYSGYFKNDKPDGEMKRYFPTGEVRVVMNYKSNGTKASAQFYRQNGSTAAQGNYVDGKRDSVWIYYGSHTQKLSQRVEYSAGKRHGSEQSFYPNGNTAEETIWHNDLKNGTWKQYFENGQLKSACTYVNGKLEGRYTSHFPDGAKETEGHYRNDAPDGEWNRYDSSGEISSTIRYANGSITNTEEMEAAEQEFFRKVMEQEGRIKEPDLEDVMREVQQNR
jgi:antitoxin component YwqK of YwqJK toxin-antitoxin module